MADIHIQPKKTSPWSYVLYGVALLAVVFLVFRSLTQSNRPVQTPPVTVDTTAVGGSVNAFLSYIHGTNSEETGSGNVTADENSPHYTSYGIHLLAAAIGATVDRDDPEDNELKDKRIRFQQLSDSLQNNWNPTGNSDAVRRAFISAADIMYDLQQRHYPNLQTVAVQMRKAAEALNPKEWPENQKDLIKTFFEQSAQVLQGMVRKAQTASLY